ncbi:hypothetical protein O3J91_06705 [Yersinia pestis]|nr:hypothetical protein [Yersinia pestis]MDL1129178.1 hypothetical protein [Yersinia pestis]
MKTIMITQRREDFGKYKPVPYAFQDWLYRLNRKDKLPRGKYFKGKVGGKPMTIIDEFSSLFNPFQNADTAWIYDYQHNAVIEKRSDGSNITHISPQGGKSSILNKSLLIPTQEQIELWRKATGNEGGIAEYQQWILATCNHAKK